MKGPDAARPTLERAVGNGCPRRADRGRDGCSNGGSDGGDLGCPAATDPASATATDTVECDGVGCRAAGGGVRCGRGSAAGDWLSGSPPRDGAREKARKSTPAADPESAPEIDTDPDPATAPAAAPDRQTAAAEATRTRVVREDAGAAAVASHAAALSIALEVRAVARVEYDEEHQHPIQNLTAQLPQQHWWWLGAAEVQHAGRG